MIDKAGKDYWSKNWEKREIPPMINDNDNSLNAYVNFKFCQIFNTLFSSYCDTKNLKVLEVGCANSIWLPYFRKKYNCEIVGIDYSENGVKLEKQILNHYSLEGDVFCADMFNAPEALLKKFDIVFTFGVIEHFDDTNQVILSIKEFIKDKGGVIVNVIPNMRGVTGFIQKHLNNDCFMTHVAIGKNELAESCRRNDLEILLCDYFLPINLSIINIENINNTIKYRILQKVNSIVSKLVWLIDKHLVGIKPNEITSPYLIMVAAKKDEESCKLQ
ncbi:class I SAM-dependent methyltransferase [Macellibacteroides fermentans]|uniref:class I SAM-dependent methyltransferase n=1 Tax=Macellibacteroides fermentans TaxID=879969 RepID=UPI00406C3935